MIKDWFSKKEAGEYVRVFTPSYKIPVIVILILGVVLFVWLKFSHVHAFIVVDGECINSEQVCCYVKPTENFEQILNAAAFVQPEVQRKELDIWKEMSKRLLSEKDVSQQITGTVVSTEVVPYESLLDLDIVTTNDETNELQGSYLKAIIQLDTPLVTGLKCKVHLFNREEAPINLF